jgi:hypothetical protein
MAAVGVGLAGQASNMIGASQAANKQADEYAQWADYQRRMRAAENTRQDELRGKAEVSREQGVQDISAENQKAEQAAEEERLAALMRGETQQPAENARTPVSVADAALTGQGGGDEVFQTTLAKSIADAAASAKQRIGALATVNSYGGSYGGLGTVNPINQAEAGAGIDAANTMRKGSLEAYGRETDVDPIQISQKQSPLGMLAPLLGVGMQGLGSAAAGGGGLGEAFGGITSGLGKMFAKRVAPETVGGIGGQLLKTARLF